MLFDWKQKLKNVSPLNWNGTVAQTVPAYAALFVFKNLQSFKLEFIAITFFAVCSYSLRFAAVYILGRLVTEVQTYSTADLISYYLPLLAAVMVLAECSDYLIRRYSEALPQVFGEYCTLRFHLLLARSGSYKLMNVSKERLLTLVGRYIGHSSTFMSDWIWSITGKLVDAVLVISVLAYQSRTILIFNLAYVCVFLAVAFYISARFSPVARVFSEKSSAASAATTGFFLNLNLLRRLGLQDFFKRAAARFTAEAWGALDRVRRFHAQRWFFQLNLFNALYIGTLGYAIYQIKLDELPLGHLVLLKWAFDRLWQILVYAIEYFVALVQQSTDADLLREILERVLDDPAALNGKGGSEYSARERFERLELRDVEVRFKKNDEDVPGRCREFVLNIPNFEVRSGDKIGVIGPSGAGKSVFFDVLMQQIPYAGEYKLNNLSVLEESPHRLYGLITSINSHDPFFKLSLRENIQLGRNLTEAQIGDMLRGMEAEGFCANLECEIGSADFHLSTGQFQRLRLVRGLLNDSEIYLLDEPFTGIDAGTRDRIMRHMQRYFASKTLVLITHNPVELNLVSKIYELQQKMTGGDGGERQEMFLIAKT